MRTRNYLLLFAVMLVTLAGCKKAEPPVPYGPVPTEAQLKWQELEFYAFIHFSMNTFTDMEWGFGDKDPQLFNPASLDCRQWCRIFKEAGMKGVIITAKHHDGFCLWPSAYTDYSVKSSPWRDGKGDLVKELSEACKEYGLKLGVYLSPWDRNRKDYGSPEYVTYFRNQLTELLTNYGDVFEVWFDGANGGTGYYGGANEERSVDRRNYYDWPGTNDFVHRLQPNAVIFSDAGPEVRWCGNESGWVGETNWSLLRRDEVWPGFPYSEQLQNGHEDGTHWVPAEVNVSIRPGWFYHKSQDDQVKSADKLLDVYYHSIGRNATWNLNIPIAPDGLVHPNDSVRLMELAKMVSEDFKENLGKGIDVETTDSRGRGYEGINLTDGDSETYWATNDGVTQASATLDLGKPTAINRFLVQEYIRLGQRVESFMVEAMVNGQWQAVANGTTIGYKRILKFPTVNAEKVRITIRGAKACPLLSNIELYCSPLRKTEDIKESVTQNPVTVKANWKVLSKGMTPESYLFDGDAASIYRLEGKEITIDLQEDRTIQGFQYLPNSEPGGIGQIFNYQFSVSADGNNWKEVSKGEFSNIRNSPVLQTITFEPVKARYIKLTALDTVDHASVVTCAELDLL